MYSDPAIKINNLKKEIEYLNKEIKELKKHFIKIILKNGRAYYRNTLSDLQKRLREAKCELNLVEIEFFIMVMNM